MAELWVKKYAPKSSHEIQGHPKAVSELKDFIINYKTKKGRAAIIYGPTGNGKTCSVYAIGDELGLEILEVNASDFRNAEQIDSKIGTASKQMSLFAKGKIILVDEIDGLSGTRDRGGISAITKLISTSAFPIVMTANNPFDKKFSTLRKRSEMIGFETLQYTTVFNVLKHISDSEKISYDEEDLKALARRAGGDLRGAIVDLQLITSSGTLSKEGVDELSGRKQAESMHQALMKVLKSTDIDIARTAYNNIDEDLDTVFLWIDYNMPKEYTKPEDLARAYDAISKADVFRGRIRRWQHWRFLVYEDALLSAGVAVAKDEKYKVFIPYKPTSLLLKIWQANIKNSKKKSIAQKLASKTHSSLKYAFKHSMPYIKTMFEKKSKDCQRIIEELELDKEEIEWLRK